MSGLCDGFWLVYLRLTTEHIQTRECNSINSVVYRNPYRAVQSMYSPVHYLLGTDVGIIPTTEHIQTRECNSINSVVYRNPYRAVESMYSPVHCLLGTDVVIMWRLLARVPQTHH
ncbi:hypothetical protein J6590_058405 [Homalodisca vitripennis]|nr:hypothetical protein J6590_058405 [Homalodisca vitripennis]